jgi:predicted nuclease of predicted toxin-antitoxin system
MKFIADEGIDASLVVLLREAGYDVLYFAEFEPSTDDEVILNLANEQNRILLTRDKDFGELVYRMKKVHSGIILSRLEELKSSTRSKIVFDFILAYQDELLGSFVVVQHGTARVRRLE